MQNSGDEDEIRQDGHDSRQYMSIYQCHCHLFLSHATLRYGEGRAFNQKHWEEQQDREQKWGEQEQRQREEVRQG